MRTLCLCRHGETSYNADARIQGQLDVALSTRGIEQAHGLASRLHDEGLQAVISSDLQRAVHTAQIVAQSLQIPLFRDVGLREANLGRAQGMSRTGALQQFGHHLHSQWHSRLADDLGASYPEGETGLQVLERSRAAIVQFLLRRAGLYRVGIITHGGVIRRLLASLSPANTRAIASKCPVLLPGKSHPIPRLAACS